MQKYSTNFLGVKVEDSRSTEVTPDKRRNFRMWLTDKLSVRRFVNRFLPVFHRTKKND